MFEINADNGTLTVAGELDRETVARVLLWIQVEDTNGVNRQTSNGTHRANTTVPAALLSCWY